MEYKWRTMAIWKMRKRLVVGSLGALLLVAGADIASAQGKLGAAAPVTYTNRYEGYLGFTLNNFQAGQNLTSHMNLGGIEVEGTRWLTPRWGVAVDGRMDAGTTPVTPNQYDNSRVLVYRETGMAGVQMRGPKNQYAAIDLHALGGVSHGTFSEGPNTNPLFVGLYSDRTKPMFDLGGSVDINLSARTAVRLAPSIILEHYGTETREWFGLSGGVVYRFGQKVHN
jgi:hypothetical protein